MQDQLLWVRSSSSSSSFSRDMDTWIPWKFTVLILKVIYPWQDSDSCQKIYPLHPISIEFWPYHAAVRAPCFALYFAMWRTVLNTLSMRIPKWRPPHNITRSACHSSGNPPPEVSEGLRQPCRNTLFLKSAGGIHKRCQHDEREDASPYQRPARATPSWHPSA